MTYTPAPLQPGDKIALVASARKVSPEEMQPAIDKLQSWGFEVVKGMYLFETDRQFAGTDQQRWADLQMMLDDASVKAILFARGGYGMVRIIDKLDFQRFLKSPKWLIGFSDVTVLHSHINVHHKTETLHAPMAINFPKTPEKILDKIRQLLSGQPVQYELSAHLFNRPGKAHAELVGGNLSLLYALAGTESDLHTKGKILFLEDLDEYLYHIDRMMMNLKRTGKLKTLKGLIVGAMNDMKDNTIPFGKSAEEIILEAVKEYDYPVCFGFNAGHLDENNPLVFGRKIKLVVTEKTTIVL
ncbi:MAG: LD-carboxypeptidase [Bacteroidota bacterium]|nr:LD-carboxypeptidase [Bacteroidota bacterium]